MALEPLGRGGPEGQASPGAFQEPSPRLCSNRPHTSQAQCRSRGHPSAGASQCRRLARIYSDAY